MFGMITAGIKKIITKINQPCGWQSERNHILKEIIEIDIIYLMRFVIELFVSRGAFLF